MNKEITYKAGRAKALHYNKITIKSCLNNVVQPFKAALFMAWNQYLSTNSYDELLLLNTFLHRLHAITPPGIEKTNSTKENSPHV